MVGFNYQGWPGYGRANGMMSGYGSSPPGYQVCAMTFACQMECPITKLTCLSVS